MLKITSIKRERNIKKGVVILCAIAIGATILVTTKLVTNAGEVEDTYLSPEIVADCEELGEAWGISPELLEALIETESSGRMSAVNGTCYGICQVNTAVWGDDYDTEYKQINKACELLIQYEDELGTDEMSYALDRYNGNSKANYNYENCILSEYANKILERAAELERVHGK